jgi:anti-sigma factor RsiW
MAEELTCQELVELVTDYYEGALAPDERVRFEMHLAGCTGCRTYMEQMRKTLRAVGQLREEHVSDAAKRELLARFRDWKRTTA